MIGKAAEEGISPAVMGEVNKALDVATKEKGAKLDSTEIMSTIGHIKTESGQTLDYIFGERRLAYLKGSKEGTPGLDVSAKPPEVTPAPETKVRGLSAGVEASAVEKSLTDTLGDLPEYKTMNMADQAKQSVDLITKDYEMAKSVAYGDTPPPGDLKPISVWEAVKQKAIKDGDVETLRDLAMSDTTRTVTEAAQTLRAAQGDYYEADPIKAMQKVKKAEEDAVQKTLGKKCVTRAVREEATASRVAYKAAAPKLKFTDLQSFIDTINC
jgi:hypothetical protein